ncbi:MAG: glycosyltransferase [Thermodesulfobacteriota bacterium]|nr:glycosyltransferase [Thermodesulfobacteriota bacterium]
MLDKLLPDAVLSIFDFSDDFVELVRRQEDKKFYFHNMTKYARAADIVLTVNEHLKNKYGFLNKNIHVLKNATNYSNFDRTKFAPITFFENIKGKGQPIIGYTGWINRTRIDFGLLDFLVERRPEWQFVFIGPADDFFIERYSQYENIHIIPPVDYKELPDYINYFDVAIVPFQINEHTKGNDLLKFHDYLAMGKPIVSTKIGGAEDLKHVIGIAQRPSEFLEEIEKSLTNKTYADISKRKNVALKNSWHNRIKELEILIENAIGR